MNKRWSIILLLLMPMSMAFATSIARGPYLSNVTTSGITVAFEVNLFSCSGGVKYATNSYWSAYGAFTNTINSPSSATHHTFMLSGLLPWTDYAYRVFTNSDSSEVHFFRTAPIGTVPFSFIAYGDPRTNQPEHRTVAQQAWSHRTQFVLNSGDLVTDGNTWLGALEWTEFFNSISNLAGDAAYYPAVGNHEDEVDGYFRPQFELPNNEQWYSFDYSNCHFVILNNCADFSPGSAQYNFVEADLTAAAGNYDFIFVCFHCPPYTCGTEHGNDTNSQTYLCPLFEANGVSIVFNGHNHGYERNFVNGIYYIVTGGGGATLYGVSPQSYTIYAESVYHYCLITINGDSLHFEAKYDDGTTFDSFDLTSPLYAEDTQNFIKGFSLNAYPNPFNSSCAIEIPNSEFLITNVEIFDLNGKSVGRLVAPITHNRPPITEFVWRPAPFISSGVYLVRVIYNGKTMTKRIAYLK